MMEVISFGNKRLSDFGVFFDGSQLFQTPKRDVTFVSIPGRSGDIIVDNGRYENQNITIPCFIREGFDEKFPELINYLLSFDDYAKLETTTLPDIYFMAKFVDVVQPQTGPYNKSGLFSLVFNCMPQKWLKSGDVTKIFMSGSEDTLKYTSYYQIKAVPLIKMSYPYGTGASFYLQGKRYATILNLDKEDVYFDFLEKDVYVIRNGKKYPANNIVELPDIRFEIDLIKENLNSWCLNVTSTGPSVVLEVTPRWYRL